MNEEREIRAPNGWAMLPVTIVIFLVGIGLLFGFVSSMARVDQTNDTLEICLLVAGLLVVGLGVFSCFGFFTLQPNEGRVLILFGSYHGTVRQSGWRPLGGGKRFPSNVDFLRAAATRRLGTGRLARLF